MSPKFPRLNRKPGLYLKKTRTKGRGVFCDRDIRAGEVLETTPAILLNERQTAHADKTILKNYTFTVGDISKKLRAQMALADSGFSSCVIMGIASFCNHSEKPNAEIVWEEKYGTVYHSLRATRRIPKHTEICTTYGEGWFDDRDDDEEAGGEDDGGDGDWVELSDD